MGYMKIQNLYRQADVLMFKEVYALEKIHGSSAHITWRDGKNLTFFAGGESHVNFVAIFDQEYLTKMFTETGSSDITVYGEVYGGKQQGMSHTYGKKMCFTAFDVSFGLNIDEKFLDVPRADDFVKSLKLEFVHYVKIPATIEALDAERDAPSVQAVRNGIGNDKIREGIVIRPLMELRKNNDERVMAKHKHAKFRETATEREVVLDAALLQKLDDAQKIANEWTTDMRLSHVLQKLNPPAESIKDTGRVVKAMILDIQAESSGEIVWSPEANKAIGQLAAKLFKNRIEPKVVPADATTA